MHIQIHKLECCDNHVYIDHYGDLCIYCKNLSTRKNQKGSILCNEHYDGYTKTEIERMKKSYSTLMKNLDYWTREGSHDCYVEFFDGNKTYRLNFKSKSKFKNSKGIQSKLIQFAKAQLNALNIDFIFNKEKIDK